MGRRFAWGLTGGARLSTDRRPLFRRNRSQFRSIAGLPSPVQDSIRVSRRIIDDEDSSDVFGATFRFDRPLPAWSLASAAGDLDKLMRSLPTTMLDPAQTERTCSAAAPGLTPRPT